MGNGAIPLNKDTLKTLFKNMKGKTASHNVLLNGPLTFCKVPINGGGWDRRGSN